jgi:hypothetical protein
MDKKTLSVAALSLAIGAGSIYMLEGGKYKRVEIQHVPAGDVLIEASSRACQDEIALVGPGVSCGRCSTRLGGAKEPVEGWCCGGAYMPERVQNCLDDAYATLPKPVEPELPPDVGAGGIGPE